MRLENQVLALCSEAIALLTLIDTILEFLPEDDLADKESKRRMAQLIETRKQAIKKNRPANTNIN